MVGLIRYVPGFHGEGIAFKSIAGLGSRLSRLGDPMFLMKGFRIQYLGSCVLSLTIGDNYALPSSLN